MSKRKRATEAMRLSGQAQGIYVLLNRTKWSLCVRAADRALIGSENLATGAEKEVAIKAARDIRAFLVGCCSPLEPIVVSET